MSVLETRQDPMSRFDPIVEEGIHLINKTDDALVLHARQPFHLRRDQMLSFLRMWDVLEVISYPISYLILSVCCLHPFFL